MPRSTIPLTLTPNSHQIHGIGYDAATRTIAIEFKSNHDRVTYHYPNESLERFQALEAAESKGRHVDKVIKPAHETDFIRMEKTDEQQPGQEGG